MLQLLLASWQQLLACLWDPDPAIRPAAAPLLGITGAAIAKGLANPPTQPPYDPRRDPGRGRLGRGGGRGVGGPTHPQGGQAPGPPATLLFDWLLPLLAGRADLPNAGRPATPDVQVSVGTLARRLVGSWWMA